MKHQVRWKGWFGKTFPPETTKLKHIDLSFVCQQTYIKKKEFQFRNVLAPTANSCSHFGDQLKVLGLKKSNFFQ